MKITTTSADKKHSFTFTTVSMNEAKDFLDFVRVHGYDAAQQYVQRTGGTCAVCLRPKIWHEKNRSTHEFFLASR